MTTIQKAISATSIEEINYWLRGGWLVKFMISESVSANPHPGDKVCGEIILIIEKTEL